MTDTNDELIAVTNGPHVLEGEYAVLRRPEYPTITQQLDMLYHDVAAGYFGDNAKNSQWFTTIKQVKEKYPKVD